MTPKKKSVDTMTAEELEAEAQALMAERAEANERIRERQLEVGAAWERRRAAEETRAQVAEMSDVQRAEMLAALQGR